MIHASNLKKTFDGFFALDGMDINVEQGSVYGLVGPNGAGKTTLLKTLMGVYKKDDGSLKIMGEDPYENKKLKEKIGFISDELYFFSNYTIKDTAKFYSKIYPNWSFDRYNSLKNAFSIDENMKIRKMSKGMKKQVAFWMIISMKPEIMILDEPVDGLDPVARKSVWNLVLQDVSERGTTVLISSHNLRELEDVCDHVGIMSKGKLLLEKELSSAKNDIHKLQIGFKDKIPKKMLEDENIINSSISGSIVTIIVKGNEEKLLEYYNSFSPALIDIISLTLEEVFIYEVGGDGYEIKNIIL
ncbi:ABC transporter ATP-binding protein [Helicovermis profundi]|uniref:ABC transporter ATP-binding protein n=1 Tax=Helicovermis profundi TaxID=3065157 RepID=A0AAU9ESJ3_9FIRM|nr:ABC transporter ATP-binding protein [Clostridia bacterium S502]